MAERSPKKVSEIDRLIDLAQAEPSHQSPAEGTSHALSIEDKKDPAPPMWRTLLQLRVLLPYLSRLLPLLEGRTLASRSDIHLDTSHFDAGLDGIESAHRDLGVQLQGQTAQIRHMQEQITWLSSAIERTTRRQEDLTIAIQSVRKLLLGLLVAVPALLLIVIVAIGFLLFGGQR